MSDKFSKIAINKNLQGKELSSNVREKVIDYAGKKLSQSDAKKFLANTFAYKSKFSREQVMKKMGLKYDVRDKLEHSIFGSGKSSSNDLKKLEIMKRRNIASSRATASITGRKDNQRIGGFLAGDNTKERTYLSMIGDAENTHSSSAFSGLNSRTGSDSKIFNRGSMNVNNKPTPGSGLGVKGGMGMGRPGGLGGLGRL